jgi:hypothetical protein
MQSGSLELIDAIKSPGKPQQKGSIKDINSSKFEFPAKSLLKIKR